jgi:hypothetical protein
MDPEDSISSLRHSAALRWYSHIVTEGFLRRKVSVQSDRLPDLSALARLWSWRLNSKYLAGLWRWDLLRGLCWYVVSPARPHRRNNSGYLSWSWASVDAHVDWDELIHELGRLPRCNTRIKCANVRLEGQDPFGRIRYGSLILRGHIFRGVVNNAGGIRVPGSKEFQVPKTRIAWDTNEIPPVEVELHALVASEKYQGFIGLAIAPVSSSMPIYRRCGMLFQPFDVWI